MIKSPLNYPGNKYKLLKQILPLFPKEIDTFVDLFGGSGTVMPNVVANNYVYNEYNYWVYKIIELFVTEDKLLLKVKNRMKELNLIKGNKDAFLNLKSNFNNGEKNALDLYLLSCFSFSNQIRFNASGEFNTPFAGDRQFSSVMEKNMPLFYEFFKNKPITLLNKNFKDVECCAGNFVYVDPPYLGTTAVYNENGGWTKENEKQLYYYLDELTSKNIYWAMSNDLTKNSLILDWAIDKYNIVDLKYDYSKSSYHSKREFGDTKEVLIINY